MNMRAGNCHIVPPPAASCRSRRPDRDGHSLTMRATRTAIVEALKAQHSSLSREALDQLNKSSRAGGHTIVSIGEV
ncbi:unnamed protein product [Colias eurytheme]|nr:unnamed protein product [Colias eurytheme]